MDCQAPTNGQPRGVHGQPRLTGSVKLCPSFLQPDLMDNSRSRQSP